jgi:hypothetical protein
VRTEVEIVTKAPESKLQEKIRKALVNKYPDSVWWKIHGGPMQRRGIPDIVGCIDGCFIAVEVKVPGRENTLTVIQQDTLDQISASGGLAFMSSSVEHTLETIKEYLHRLRG